MYQERRLAAERGYPDPINPTYEATTDMYNKVANELLARIQADTTGEQVQVLFATHNEDTVQYVVNRYNNNEQLCTDFSSLNV